MVLSHQIQTGKIIICNFKDYLLNSFNFRPDSPPILNLRGATSVGGSKPGQVGGLKTLRMGRKDYKKGGDALRGKNVTEAFRVKDKDLKRTMK